MIDEAAAARFWAQVDTSGECWLWASALADSGHGSFRHSGRTVGAHCIAYELTYGSVPTGRLVCHSCNNAQCVRPTHLYAGTSAQNRQDRARAGIYRYNVPKAVGANLLSPTRTMRYLGIDAVALYWLVQSGELPIYRSHANRWCYKRDEVVALAEKATRDGRALSMCRIAEESGANISTVNRLANNTIKRIPVDELTLLCRYLDCNVGDLIRMEEVAT